MVYLCFVYEKGRHKIRKLSEVEVLRYHHNIMEENIKHIEDLFFLPRNKLQQKLDKIESGNHALFSKNCDNEEYPRFVEKVVFSPKKWNVEFPAVEPGACSRGVKSTSSLPDIRNTDYMDNPGPSPTSEELSNSSQDHGSLDKTTRSRVKAKPYGIGSFTLTGSGASLSPRKQDEPLFCRGKGFPKIELPENKVETQRSKSAVDIERVRLENTSSKTENTPMIGLPRISDKNGNVVEQPIKTGPCFRAWSSQKREIPDNVKEDDPHNTPLDPIEQKAVRSFDIDGLLKEVRRNQQARQIHKESFHQSMDEISLSSAASYASKIKRELAMSSKGGGFMNREKHISIKEEILIKKLLRQKLFSFYDFGGSENAFERVVMDSCSKKNPSIKYKNLPAYSTEERNIFPLSAPHSYLPLLPYSPVQLQKLHNMLDTFPWFSWRPRRSLDSVVIRGSQATQEVRHCDVEADVSLSDDEVDYSTTKARSKRTELEIHLPSC